MTNGLDAAVHRSNPSNEGLGTSLMTNCWCSLGHQNLPAENGMIKGFYTLEEDLEHGLKLK